MIFHIIDSVSEPFLHLSARTNSAEIGSFRTKHLFCFGLVLLVCFGLGVFF